MTIKDQIGDFIASGKYSVVFSNIENDNTVILSGIIYNDAFKLLAYQEIGALHAIETNGNEYYAIVTKFRVWRKNGDQKTKNIVEYFTSLITEFSERFCDDCQFLSELLMSKALPKNAQVITQLALELGNFSGMWLDNHLGNWFVNGNDCLPIDLFNFDDLPNETLSIIFDRLGINPLV